MHFTKFVNCICIEKVVEKVWGPRRAFMARIIQDFENSLKVHMKSIQIVIGIVFSPLLLIAMGWLNPWRHSNTANIRFYIRSKRRLWLPVNKLNGNRKGYYVNLKLNVIIRITTQQNRHTNRLVHIYILTLYDKKKRNMRRELFPIHIDTNTLSEWNASWFHVSFAFCYSFWR